MPNRYFPLDVGHTAIHIAEVVHHAMLSVQGLICTILLEQHVLVRLQEIYVWLIFPFM